MFDDLSFCGSCYWESPQVESVAAALVRNTKYKTPPLSSRELATNFLSFLKQCKARLLPYEKLTPAGHNVKFDLSHLEVFFNRCDYHDFLQAVDYHFVDTMCIGAVMKDMGLLDRKQSLSLSALCRAFHVEHEDAHDAVADVEATKKLYDAMVKRLSGGTF